MWRVKDCKAVVGEHVTTQHKPVVFVVRMEKRSEIKSRGQKWRGNVIIEDKERMRVRLKQLSKEAEGLEEEWKKYRGVLGNCRSFVWKDVRKGSIVQG